MASIGQSKQTVQARAKQLKDGNAFLNYIETASEDGELATRWGTVWEEVSEEELGQRDTGRTWRRTSSRSTGSRKASRTLANFWTSTPRKWTDLSTRPVMRWSTLYECEGKGAMCLTESRARMHARCTPASGSTSLPQCCCTLRLPRALSLPAMPARAATGRSACSVH